MSFALATHRGKTREYNMLMKRADHARSKQTCLIACACLLLIMLIYGLGTGNLFGPTVSPSRLRHMNILKKVARNMLQSKDQVSDVGNAPPPISESEKLKSILSSIEFFNPLYLDVNSTSSSSTLVPIIVLSKASNMEQRDAIRRTWALDESYRNGAIKVKVIFLVGTDDYMIRRIRAEQILFDDVVQVSLSDMNSFLAYKELSALLWVRAHLPDAHFYVKTEDDVMLNIQGVVDQLVPVIEGVVEQSVVVGWFGSEHALQRGTYQKFINAVLPPSTVDLHYAMGLLYAVTSKAADRILDVLSDVESVEYPGDPFVTGVLRNAAEVESHELNKSLGNDRYAVMKAGCREAFERNPRLLLCTSAPYSGVTPSTIEYFDVWNTLLTVK
jgi:hypothetical protein